MLQNTAKQDTPQLAALGQECCPQVGLRDFRKQPLGLMLISVADKEEAPTLIENLASLSTCREQQILQKNT